MKPITRKELYLNKIVGNNDYEIPEKPITTEEFFFAEILGEAVQAPEPLTRYQMYLAKIAGREIEIPTPITRLEYFLAKAAGMDITVPVPITREEIFWSNYTAIVEFEVEGVPPLTYKAIEGTLENYRIYGNTVNGESVGDRTGNLFDETNGVVTDIYIRDDGTTYPGSTGDRFICNRINVIPNTEYTFSWQQMVLGTANNSPYIRVSSYDDNNNFIIRELIQASQWLNKIYTITTANNAAYLDIRIDDASSTRGQHLEGIMLNTGSTPLPYEPYGYRVPVTVTNGTDTETTNLYLPEQIKMVGDEAEYIDFGEQKQHRVRKNLLNIETDIIPLGFQYGTVTIFNDLNVKGFFKECEPNTAYTISRKTSSINNRFSIGFSSIKPENGLTQSLLDYTTPLDTLATSLTLTSPAGARYVCCYLSNINEDITPDMEIMLEKNDYATDYEPYIEDTELDVTLPALPTLSGTNTLSVGTEVQPSKVYVKGTKEREYT